MEALLAMAEQNLPIPFGSSNSPSTSSKGARWVLIAPEPELFALHMQVFS